VSRTITARQRHSALLLTESIASLIAIELAVPGNELYIAAPVITDMLLLPNRAGEFDALMPDTPGLPLRLGICLALLAERGTQVRVIYPRNEVQTETFLASVPAAVERRATDSFLIQGLTSETYYLRGAFNLTPFGAALDEAQVSLETSAHAISRALLEFRQFWDELGP
jgi:hypothetical protein